MNSCTVFSVVRRFSSNAPISSVADRAFSPPRVSCLSSSAASTSAPHASSFRRRGTSRPSTAAVSSRRMRKSFYRGWWPSCVAFYRKWTDGACASPEFKVFLETASNFKTLKKGPWAVCENTKKAVKSLEFSSRANQISDGSRLKVDGNH